MSFLTAPETKILSLCQATARREELRKLHKTIVLTNGCFDVLHRGHAQYLLDARSRGDALIVLINSDSSVRALKGPARPVNTQEDRAYLLACLESVDMVVVFDGKRCTSELASLKPDIYAKGGDYTVETLDPEERAALLSAGASFAFIPFVPGLSSTRLIQKLTLPET